MKTKVILTDNELKNSGFRRFEISIKLADECHNGHDDFSITGSAWYNDDFTRDGSIGGCVHDEILKLRPDLKIFVDLHLCNFKGQPMYPIENGYYHLFESSKDTAINYLRITSNQYDILRNSGDKKHFQIQLENLGILEQWQNEANEGIKLLEQMTGEKYVNKDTKETLKPLTEEERKEVFEKLDNGYYSIDEVTKRKNQSIEDAKNKIITDLKNEAKKKKKEIDRDLKIDLYLISLGIPRFNYIYYSHTNKLVFNWNPPYNQITSEQYTNFINSVDLSQFPKGIEFSFGK